MPAETQLRPRGFAARFPIAGTVSILVAMFALPLLAGSSYTYIGGAGAANWSDTTKWSGGPAGTYPGQSAGDTATISTAGALVTVDTAVANAVVLQLSSAALSIPTGDSLTLAGTSALGGIIAISGGTLGVASGATATSTASITGSGGTISNSGTFIWSSGSITVTAATTLDNNGALTIANDNSVVASGGSLTLNNTGTLSKSGTTGTASLAGTTLNNTGLVDIHTGILSVATFQPNSATLEVHIAGTSAGTGYTQLQIGNAPTLGGTLSVTTTFTPANGTTFPVVTFPSATGDFSQLAGLAYTGGTFTYAKGATSSVLTAGSPVSTLTVVNNNDSGTGSLRQAILDANAGNCTLPCTITFNVLPAGPWTIQPLTDLPILKIGNVAIDATTQPGYAGKPLILLDGSAQTGGVGGEGIEIDSTGSNAVKGLAIGNFTDGIVIDNGGGDSIASNYIGLALDGTTAAPIDGDGIIVYGDGLLGSDGNHIGVSGGGRNVVIYCSNIGIGLQSSSNNTVDGNYVGLDATGTTPDVQTYGPSIFGPGIGIHIGTNNTIGGTTAAQRNVIAGCLDGIDISGEFHGTMAVPPHVRSLRMPGRFTTEKAKAAAARYAATPRLQYLRSRVSAMSGRKAAPNTIFPASNNIIAGNYIGTDPTGTVAILNIGPGVDMYNEAFSNVIGGTAGLSTGSCTGACNLIASSDSAVLFESATSSNTVEGNYIGTDVTGANPLPNGTGVYIQAGSDHNTIGGAAGNIIAFGNGCGCPGSGGIVFDLAGIGNAILGNSIHDNAINGIDLDEAIDGPDVNDDANGDVDTGSNNFQNWPELASAGLIGGNVQVPFILNSSAVPTTQSFRIEVFKSDSVDIPNNKYGEGKVFLGAQCFDGNNLNATAIVPATGLVAGDSIVATATSYTGSCASPGAVNDGTSEFSNAVVTACTPYTPTITPSGPTTFCAGGSVTLNAPAGYASYLWSNGATTPSITVSASGSFTVTTTDSNGCPSSPSAPVVVTVNPLPPATITPSGPTTFCAGGSVTLNANTGAGLTYLWSTGATTQSISVGASGSYTVTVKDANGCSATSAPTTVTVHPLPSATITPSGPTSFCAGGNVTLSAPAGLTYAWSTGATTQSIAVSATGSYTVTVTDSNGCTATSAPTNVTVNPLPATPVVTPGGPTTFCSGGSVTLSAPGGFTYLWSTGATTQSITVSAAGSYFVTVKDANGCSATSGNTTVTVHLLPTPTITPSGPTTFCAGGNVTLSAPSGFNSYLWSTGATTQSINVTASGNYTVTVTDANGCSGTSPATTVTANPLPAPTITPSGPTTFCAGGSVTLSAPAGFASYLWSTGATSQSITVSTTGSYSVTVTDANGCSGTSAPTSVTAGSAVVPLITPSGPTTFCAGGSVTLTASAGFASYLWSNGATTQSITVSASGSYTVTVSNAGGCNGTSAATNVTVNPLPPTPVINASGPTTFCAGGSVTLSAPAGFVSYLWSTGATTQSINVGSSGSYSVTVTDSNGCSATSAPANVTVNAVPSPVVTASGPTTFCAGGQVTLSAPAGFTSYLWSNGAATQSINVNASGSYSVTVTNSNGCSGTSAPTSVTVAAAINPVITASGPTTFCAGGSVILSAPAGFATYLWSTGATTQSINVTSSGTFTISVSDGNGCSGTSGSQSVTVTPNPDATITAPATMTGGSSGSASVPAGVAGTTYSWTVTGGTLTSSATARSVTFVAGALGGVSLSVTVSSGGCSSSSTANVPINAAIVLGVTISGPSDAENGSTVVYIINVSNNGAGTVSGITIDAPQPGGLDLVSIQGGCTSLPCTIPSLPPGGNVQLTLTYIVSAPPGAQIFSRATVHAGTSAANDRTATMTTVVDGCGEAAPSLIAPADGAAVTSPITFQWTSVANATTYDVYVRTPGGLLHVASTSSTSVTANVPAGAASWYVVATLPCGALSSSTGRLNVCGAVAAPLPDVVAQTSSQQTYRLEWQPVANAGSYEVDEAASADFAGAVTHAVDATSIDFTYSVTSAQPFFYRVRAISACNRAKGPDSSTMRVVVMPLPKAGDPPEVNAPAGSTTPLDFELFVPGIAGGTYSFTATTDRPWVTVDPSSGALPPTGFTLHVRIVPTGLPNGTSMGTVIVTVVTPGASKFARAEGTTVVSLPVSVSIATPVMPTSPAATTDTMIIPSVTRVEGSNSQWRSDIRIANSGAARQQFIATFTPAANVAGGTRQTTLTIDGGATTALDDVLHNWFGVGSLGDTASGFFSVRSASAPAGGAPSASLVVSSRTYDTSNDGTLGEFIPAIPFSRFIGAPVQGSAPTIVSLQQIAQSAAFRTNVGLMEASGQPASASLNVFNSSGDRIAQVPFTLNGFGQRQLNSFLAQQGLNVDDGRIEVAVTGGAGRIAAYASVVDNVTDDPMLVSGTALGSFTATRYVLPGVADLNTGLADWRTDVRLFNSASTAQAATLTFYPADGSAPVNATATIEPGHVAELNGVVRSLFGLSNIGGAVHVTTPNASSLVVTGRTYNALDGGGTYGQFIPAVTSADAIGSSDRALNILQVEDSSRFRTNLGIAEVAGQPATAVITVYLPDSKVTPRIDIPLQPFEYRQFPIIQQLGLANVYNARVTVSVVGGSGKITAYGSVIDQKTQDPTYVPAQ